MEFLISFLNYTNLFVNCVAKLPQIFALYSSKKTTGVSLQSVLLEFMAFTLYMSYNIYFNYPLMSYIEYPIAYIQDGVIILMILHYRRQLGPTTTVAFSSIYFAIAYSFVIIPYLMRIAVTICTMLSSYSKISQLQELFKLKNSSAVSLATWSLAAFTCFTRLVTTMLGTRDIWIIVHYCVLLALNIAIISAILKFKPTKDIEKQE